jgi:molybdopterin-containing oxidoreductase family iron-sulfur binding subunit
MLKYGMVIDLRKCIGCMTCTIACKVENATRPGIFWCKVKDMEFGKYPSVKRTFLPIQCAHCSDPHCVDACPTGASHKGDDGIVSIDYKKCAGCKYCIETCPYEARSFVRGRAGYFGKELTPYEKQGYEKHEVGVVEKCTFCSHRLKVGKLPACVKACVGKARYFGDLNDPDSEVSRLLRSKNATQLEKELGADPSVFYILP